MSAERLPVEASHILMFARAIGDENPAFVDPDSPEAQAAGGVVAPPTFTMASAQFDEDNVLRPKPGEPWFGSGKGPGTPREGGAGRLHAEQIFEYHRPMRAGDVLRPTRPGRSWEKTSRSGGTLTFNETVTEFRDEAIGELVVTATSVGVITQAPSEQEG